MPVDNALLLLLRELQDALVETTAPSRTTYEAGGFIIMLTDHDPMIWMNYAVPTSSFTPDGVNEMTSIFRSMFRSPRLEFFVELWPELSEELERHGFACEKRMPIMVIERSEWSGLKNDLDVRDVQLADLRELGAALGEAYGMPTDPDPESGIKSMTESLAAGRALGAFVMIDGILAGGGYAIGTSKIREVAGIGTREAFRRRGVASATIARLLDRFFASGGEVAWLTPGDDSAQSVYSRLGFRPVAEQVCYQLLD